jgi:hypothetical protein
VSRTRSAIREVALLTDPGTGTPRFTIDVDLFVEAATARRYHEVEAALRSAGFTQDVAGQSLQCRWSRHELIVDVMPDDPAVLGFSNR